MPTNSMPCSAPCSSILASVRAPNSSITAGVELANEVLGHAQARCSELVVVGLEFVAPVGEAVPPSL